MFVIMIVSLFTVRIVLQTLGVEDYGVYNAVGGVVLALSIISRILSSASQRFFSYELGRNDKDKLKEVFCTISICYIGISVLIILIAETIGLWFVYSKMVIPSGRMEAALWVYQFAIFSFVVSVMANPYQAIIVSHEKMGIYAYISIAEVVARLVIVYLLLVFPIDKLKLYSILMFLTTLSINTLYIIYCRNKFEESKFQWKWNKQQFKSVFSYSSWTFFGTIAGQCNTQGVNILLNLFFGPTANAAYSIGSQVSHQVQGFGLNFYTAVKPPLIKSYAQCDYVYMNKLFYFSSKALFILLYIIILPIFIGTHELLDLWLGKVEIYMVDFVRLFLIYTLILCVSNPITTLVQAAGEVKLYHSLVDGFSLIALPIAYVLLKLGSPANTCFYVTIVIFSIAHFLRLYVAKRVIEQFSVYNYIKKIVIPIFLSVLVTFLPLLKFHSNLNGGMLNLILMFLVSIVLNVFAAFFIILNRDERKLLLNLVRKKM